jgi:uncharacterized membrane protein YccC
MLSSASGDTAIGADQPIETTRIRRLLARLAILQKRLPDRQRLTSGLAHGALSAIAALIAYLPTRALGLQEGFWAAITAIAVMQNELDKTRTTARDQFAGAAVGGVIGVVIVTLTGQTLASYALAVVLSMTACALLNVASAARLSGITATIILLVPHQGTVQAMMASRVVEVGWGVLVAIVVVWLAGRIGQIRTRKKEGH